MKGNIKFSKREHVIHCFWQGCNVLKEITFLELPNALITEAPKIPSTLLSASFNAVAFHFVGCIGSYWKPLCRGFFSFLY